MLQKVDVSESLTLEDYEAFGHLTRAVRELKRARVSSGEAGKRTQPSRGSTD